MDRQERFSIRKLTVGVASVAIGFWLAGSDNIAHADTVDGNVSQTQVKTDSANTDALAESKTNTSDSSVVKPNTTPVETKKNEARSVDATTPKTNVASTGANANSATSTETKRDKVNSVVANSNNALAQAKSVKAESATQPKANGTSIEAKPNEHGSSAANPNAVSTEVKPNAAGPASLAKIKLAKTLNVKLVKQVDAKTLTESKVVTDNQFNFDDWTTQIDDTYLNITGYKGDRSKQIVVPNGADFAKAGKNDKNLQVEINSDTLADLIVDGVAPKLSSTDGQKIVAKGYDWSDPFSDIDLHDISGLANLDTSNVSNMSAMFYNSQISDLSPLANWNTGKVTDMSGMFEGNQIRNLSPLANWNIGKVTDMSDMFNGNQISDLSPLANWNIGKVTDMSNMFEGNQISDLSPLANWNTGKVTNMSSMFKSNQISDLSPLVNWNIGNVTDMYGMFDDNQISDLSPLANWNIGKVTDMGDMFNGNQISDLSPLANWNTGNVTDMSDMFNGNHISDLSPLANWNTGKVTNMSSMFKSNQISDLSPLANWNTGKVINMSVMLANNRISDLSPLVNWNTDNVANMSGMLATNQISDLSPLANWNTGNVTDMSSMFSTNQISDLSPLANWNTANVTYMNNMFKSNQISDLSPLANWNTNNVTGMEGMFNNDPLNSAFNSQSTLNKFNVIAYKLDNIGTLVSHNENKTFNDGSQVSLDKNVVTKGNSATLTFKANSLAGNTYQIEIYNPNQFIDIQAAALPTALGTTYISYQDGCTIITNKFINNGSVSQVISITPESIYFDMPAFAQYESTSGLITVAKDKEDLGSINITYQNVSDVNNIISAPYIGKKPYINHTQNTFYFQPQINGYSPNNPYSFIKSAGLTITVPDDVTIDPDTFIDAKTGKTLKGAKIADHQYQVVLTNTTDWIAVKGVINVSADKLANGTAHLPGFGMKYIINTYNDKVAPSIATNTSKELSVIPDLASYHGALIDINQSKWAFDRNGNKVYNYTSQGFYNTFNGVPLEPAVSTQVTNGVETFDMPAGVNITDFDPHFNKDVIDHIDYIYTDGSKETFSVWDKTSKAIRQMKVYFKNGIQSDELADDSSSDFDLSFDATYPDGSPIKNFDTFKITGSFSCDELGSTDNVEVAQVMLAPTQKLTDGMQTDTSQDESNKAPNASSNFISATIRNDGFQHQGHLTNPIFYFKYNNLMVPDLSEISASFDNQNQELDSTGSTYIDEDKIHSSIITDSNGQKFIKVQIDGEYYYGGSSGNFNVQIHITNSPDALTATKDWSWYILNDSDEAKTESVIQNSVLSSSLSPVTIDGNTLSVGGTGTWQIIVAQGFTSGTETQGNLNGGPGLVSTQDDHLQDPTHFNIYDSIINATNDAKRDLVSVTNLPSTQDGKSQFDVYMTGKASLINVMTGQTYDATITYSYGTGDNNFITSDQITDWSKVKSIKVVPNGGAPSLTSLRLVVSVEDKTVYDDVGKTIYMSTMTYGEDKANTNYTTKDGFAVPEKSTILPIIIKPGDAASAKLTVRGQATVHTLIHYKDENGKDVYVKLADKDKTYNELQDTMRRSDYLQSDRDLTMADRGLLPTGMVINYNNPTIRNSNNTYVAGYANGAASFGETAKYDFDGDQVIFEGAMPEVITKTHQVKETIHYVYRDGSTAKPDKVLTSITLKQTGYKNPFTGEITWDTSTTDTLNSVDSPEITGYIADQLTVPSYTVTMDSPDKEVIVTYDADNENADFTYFDDTTSSKLKTVNKSGKSNTAIGYTTTDEIKNYEKQGYVLVSDDTDGRNLNFDSLPTVDQHYMIHLKHKTERVTGNGTVTRTIHYLYDNGNTAKPDKTQTVSFNETGTKDDVTGKTTWDNDDAQTVDNVTTPSITGYTPDKSSIEEQSFKFGDKDVEVTVRYNANTQKAKITYIDDTTKTNLESKDAKGKFGQAITFATAPTDEIENYKKQGYVLVSNTFDNQTYDANNDNNVFYVHLKHGTKNVSRTDDVNMTVHYVMDDDSVAPSENKQTLSFTENGIQDLVTKHIDWTPAVSQTFKDVVTPNVAGYTPDKESVAGPTVNFGDNDVEVTVRYNANTQNAKITYVDDTTKTDLDSKDASGKFGQAINFATAPADEIASYKNQGYVFESSTFDDNKYQADDGNNVFYVHFVHGTKDVSRNSNVNMTVHYVMDDNSDVPSDNKQTLSFTENGIQDLVTKHIDWTPAVSQTFKDVDSPVLTGYTADIKTANGKIVNFGDPDINVTVHYSANTQTATITYIDDTEKKTLSSDNQSGKFNQAIAFEHDPAEVIKGFEEKGYVFVSNSFDNQKYQADDGNNVFYVHFVHGTKDVSRTDDVNMTVHYVMDDNSEAPSDNKQTLSFTENGTQDLVTKHIDWTTANSQAFKDVATKSIVGYTPDKESVAGQTVNFGDNDVEATVTYSPNVQIGHINYIDDDTKKTLTHDDFSGRTNEHEDYTSTDRIQEFENKGYELVSSDYPDGGFNFDNNDRQDQVFNVHFKHGIVTVTSKKPQIPNTTIDPDPHSPKYPEDISNTNSDVKRTIDYKFKDGKTAQPTVKDSLHFERTVVIDKVTGKVLSDTWTQSQNFSDIQTPAIQGYTPDKPVISDKNIDHDHQDIIEHIVYSPDVQHMTITYIDDTTGETLHTDNPKGVSDQDANYTTSDAIKQFEDQHYKLVSDSTKGQDLIFDHDDDADQVYEVHFVHDTHSVDDQTTKSEVIHYVYADGLARQGKVTDDNVQQLSFTRDGYNDEVTGTDHWNAWTPDTQEFALVKSPEIQGYTADQVEVSAIKVNADSDNIEHTVTYKANKQKLDVAFIDDTTGDTLSTITKDGVSDENVNYNTKDDINHYKSLHYNVVSDGTQGQNLVFDHDDSKDQHYEVHLVHATHSISESTSTKQIIHYQLADGTKVFDDHTAQVDFSRDGYNDEVTNENHWNKWQPNETQAFAAVKSPIKPGYTPDLAVIDEMTIKPHAEDIDKTVTYMPDKQTIIVNYIDKTSGRKLETKTLSGMSDEKSTYTTTNTINMYLKDHYVLINDDTNGNNLIFDHDDSNNQIYNVTFDHQHQTVSSHVDIDETIHYIYDNGQTAKPDYHADPVRFERVGDKDCVTNEIKWDNWTSNTNRFISVVTPAINGYTPDIERVSSVVVDPESKDIEQTVVYKADDQTILINYIDDDTNRTIKTDTVIGKTAQNSDYSTKDSISTYISNHYLLVSDDTHGEKLVFDSDSTKPQIYNVHLKHEHQKVSDSKIVHETIHYVYADGKQVAPEYHADAIKFDRIGDQDCVTKNIAWQNWSPENAEFTSVKLPIVLGYTPNRAYVDQIAVTPDSEDIDETVTYNPDEQYILINYIDDVTGKTLKTDTLTGKSDRVSDYTTKNNIHGYENQYYVLVSDDTHGKTLNFDHDDSSDQIYNVHLTHATTDVKRTRKVNETIDYVYADGKQAAKTFESEPLIFTQTGVKDLVNGKIDWNGQWTDAQSFATVDSPEITGYTPSQKSVNAISVSHDSKDVNQIVIYTANTQKAVITYVDDTDGDIVACDKTAGRFGEMIKFDHNVDDRIKAFENQGYRLVSNNFDNQTYMANNEQNVFVVHLTHGKTNVQRDDIVTETIEYQFEDGQKAHDSMIQQIKFVQNGIQDSVTKSVVWTPSDPQNFESVTTPNIDGYTPNISQISAKTITFGDSDLTYVVKYIANMQNAKILYIDDNTGTLLKSDHTTGKFNTIIDFNINPITQISEYINSGYRLVSNNFNNQAYKTDNEQNRFTVHLAHNTQNVQRSKTLMRVIKYQYTNGQKASDDVVQTAEFTQQGVKDLVNDEITWSQTSDHQFARVITPQIVGYYPDKTSIDTETISYDGHNQTIIVTYKAQELPAQLRIIDDTTGQVLAIDDASGKYHELIEFTDLQKQLQDLQKHGYQITSNTFNNQHYNVDKSQNLFEIHVIKHDDIKHDDIKHDDIKHDDIKHDDIKHEDIKHDDIKHDDIKHDDIKHEDIKHEDIKHEDIKHEDIKHEDIKHYDIKHEDIKHEDIKHEDIKHDDSLIIRKVHKSEKTLPQTGAEDTRTSSVIGAISSLIAGLGLVGVSRKKRKNND